jgi:two-component system sensor histidine kinase MprB
LVVVAAIAVVLAVFAASAASYFAAKNSLIGSIDGTMQATASAAVHSHHALPQVGSTGISGLDYQYVASTGELIERTSVLPSSAITSHIVDVARGTTSSYFADTTIGTVPYREYAVHLDAVTFITSYGLRRRVPNVALVIVSPLTGVDHQLLDLRLTLAGVACVGIVLALVLAWLIGRTSLAPLHELTAAVEEVAATTDVSRRLDPGGPDELGRLRRAFNHLLSALERSQEAQRQLVLDAGHELRTPLTSLRTNLEVVRRLEELSPDEREVLVDDLLTQINELTTLVGDLSELARGSQRQIVPSLLRLDRLVDDAVAIATTHGRLRDISFTVSTAPTWVLAQRDRLNRAVGNLLDNALKWSPPGGVVEVDCREGVVTVRDHGPGIAPEDLPHVFDRFYRASTARALPGSGLGLAIVAQVAQDEHGAVWAGPAPGGGAMFRLQLPAVAPPSQGTVDDDDEE